MDFKRKEKKKKHEGISTISFTRFTLDRNWGKRHGGISVPMEPRSHGKGKIEKQASPLRHGAVSTEIGQHAGETGLVSPALQSRGR